MGNLNNITALQPKQIILNAALVTRAFSFRTDLPMPHQLK